MAATRPYFLVFKGEKHIIEAPAAANAVQHVVGADISELRPARAAEVTAWVRAGNPIPVAGEEAAASSVIPGGDVATQTPAGDAVVSLDRDGWDERDALIWVQEQEGFTESAAACQAWGRISSSKRMTLKNFDIIRGAAPSFAEAVAYATTGAPPTDVEQIRASLEENPMSIDDLVEAIGEAKRRDLYVDRDVGALEDGTVQE